MTALKEFFEGSIGKPFAWRQTLREMTTLLILGLAVFIALRAGLFNIGAEGQLLVGAAASAAIGLRVPGVMGMIFGCLAGMIAGAIWALPAAWIKAFRGGHEVISTIMLNNVAGFFTVWLAANPLRDPTQQSPTTALLKPDSWFPLMIDAQPFRVSWALPLGLVGVALLAWWLKRSISGFELQATGANLGVARTAGIETRSILMRAMFISGAIAGLAGAILVLGFEHRFYSNFSQGYGFDALGVALLAGGSAWGLIPSSFLFAMLSSGTSAIQLTGVPKGINGILLAILIIVFATIRYRRSQQHHD